MLNPFQQRVADRLNELRRGAVEAAQSAGLDKDYVRDIIEGRKKSVREDKLSLLAAALDWSVDDLRGTSSGKDADRALRNPPLEPSSAIPLATKLVPYLIAGTAQAGNFKEVWEYDQSEPEYVYAEPDVDFPQARRFACKVAGDSMNDLKPHAIVEGSTAIGVSYEDISNLFPLRPGLIVVVQRERDGGHIREWSIKQIEIRGSEIWFCPRSTNSRHKAFSIPMVYEPEDGDRVEVLALVRGVMNKFSL